MPGATRRNFFCNPSFVLRGLILLLCFATVGQQLASAAALQTSSSAPSSVPSASPAASVTPPLPAQLRAAHRVFVSNLGAEGDFRVDPDIGYKQFYAALQTWGRYQLVASPGGADLIFEFRAAAPLTGVSVTNGSGSSYARPELQLTILDPTTHVTLWAMKEPVVLAVRRKAREKSFERSVAALTSKLKLLVGEPLTSHELTALREDGKDHSMRNTGIVVGVSVAAAVTSGLLLKHAFDSHKNDAPASLTCATNPLFCVH